MGLDTLDIISTQYDRQRQRGGSQRARQPFPMVGRPGQNLPGPSPRGSLSILRRKLKEMMSRGKR